MKRLLKYLCILLPFVSSAAAQEQTLKYKVMFNGESIGNVDCYKRKEGDNLYLKLISNAQLQFILKMKINTIEESMFQNGKLMYSSSLRKVNGKEKVNRQTKAEGNLYRLISNEKTSSINCPAICYNLILLYYSEPKDNQLVYSDAYQQFLTVKQTGIHQYKLELPDGNFNYYSYKNGICTNVDIHHSLYRIQLQLIS